jgi:hypothetical protein
VALAQVADPTVQAAVLQIVDQSAAAGEKRRPGQQANYFSLEDIVPAGDGRSGTVKVCEFDGSLRYNATSESVVEDRVSSFEIVYTGQQATDGWRVVGVEEVNRWIGVNQCGPPTP